MSDISDTATIKDFVLMPVVFLVFHADARGNFFIRRLKQQRRIM